MRYTMKGLIIALALALTGCVSNFRDTTAYYHSGKPKPCVALLPVIDNTAQKDLSWDLSYEFTQEMKKRLCDSHKLYLVREQTASMNQALSINKSLCCLNRAELEAVGTAEFVIISELIEQSITPYGPLAKGPEKKFVTEAGAMLTLAMRISVVDMRKDTPEIVLQEVIDTDYNIPRSCLYINYGKHPYGSDFFVKTPIGIAHAKLIREAIAHIEGYVGAR